jgi:hypothetical protein
VNQSGFIRSLARALDQGTRELDAATTARLAAMRREAVRGGGRHTGQGALVHAHRHPWLSIAMAAGLLLAGWFVLHLQQPSDNAETDILLLTDELPPNAYAEQDFAKWLQAQGN